MDKVQKRSNSSVCYINLFYIVYSNNVAAEQMIHAAFNWMHIANGLL
jgi:hypothetical protein